MNKFIQKTRPQNAGFTIPELVVYIGIMTLALVSVVTLLVNSAKIMQVVKSEKEIRNSALTALERMTREIKGSEAVVSSESSFGESSGRLSILSRLVEENPRKVNFLINDNDELEILYDNVVAGTLTSSEVVVDELIFSHFTHGNSESVRIELVLYPEEQPSKKTTFYSTAVLRGTY